MPPGLCDRLGRSFDQWLELAIGGQGKPLNDRAVQDALAAFYFSEIVTEPATPSPVTSTLPSPRSSAAPPQPRPGKTPAGQDSEARIHHFKVTIATLRSNP
jgi:hypothetical protein